ncbi:MAG: DUF4831 family protein [Bacteroidia bacterium]|nr:DUF4831 family protein [Bacteroidia bacterium]
MRRVAILLIISFLVAGTVIAQKSDKKKSVSELSVFNGGVIYSLPRTGIRVMVEVSQEKFFRGPYSEFAQKYIGVKSVSSSDAEFWKITDLKMETFGEPDPAEMHKATGAIASMLSLSDDGVLIGINSSVKSEARKTYTSVFTPDIELPREIWSEMSMHSFLVGKDTTHHSGDKLKSVEEKAAEAAHDIMKLRKRKALVLAADYDKLPPDGKAYQVMVDELNKIIGDYESLFIGKSYKSTHKYVFEVVPDAKGNKALVAFRFSATAGVLPESNVSGKPIMLELDPNPDLVRNGEQKAAPSAGETTNNGLFYRTPGLVVARLLNGSDVLAQARLSMAQFGVVTAIPDGLMSGEYSIEFHPVTGAIQRIGN